MTSLPPEPAEGAAAARILVVDDELPVRKFLRAVLAGEGYEVAEAASAAEGLREWTSRPPDLVLLDLGLPDRDGLDVLRQVREWSNVPTIVLSARGLERDKVAALDGGADDYLVKPFGPGELTARIRVALRHAAARAGGASTPRFVVGDLEVDAAARTVKLRGEPVRLTNLEYRLLALLTKHAGKVLTHRFLLREVWGPQASQETHYLRVYLAGLRKKLEDDPAQPRYLLTEQGVGYRLADL